MSHKRVARYCETLIPDTSCATRFPLCVRHPGLLADGLTGFLDGPRFAQRWHVLPAGGPVCGDHAGAVRAAVHDADNVVADDGRVDLWEERVAGPATPRAPERELHGLLVARHGLDAQRQHSHRQPLADDLLLARLVHPVTDHAAHYAAGGRAHVLHTRHPALL